MSICGTTTRESIEANDFGMTENVPMTLARSKLRIQWEVAGDQPAARFATALASLLSDCTDEIRVTG